MANRRPRHGCPILRSRCAVRDPAAWSITTRYRDPKRHRGQHAGAAMRSLPRSTIDRESATGTRPRRRSTLGPEAYCTCWLNLRICTNQDAKQNAEDERNYSKHQKRSTGPSDAGLWAKHAEGEKQLHRCRLRLTPRSVLHDENPKQCNRRAECADQCCKSEPFGSEAPNCQSRSYRTSQGQEGGGLAHMPNAVLAGRGPAVVGSVPARPPRSG
jgi:hypothetical protein